MLAIAVCDDDVAFCAELCERLSRLPELAQAQVAEFCSADGLSRAVQDGYAPEIAFLDIMLEQASGIESARRLFGAGRTQVIYMTSFTEPFQEVYETEHVWLLRKPFTDDALKKAVRKACSRMEEQRRTFSFRTGGTTVSYPQEDILYCESQGRKVVLHTAGGDAEQYATLSAIADAAGPQFVQCHKSFLVNLRHVMSLEHKQFVMDNRKTVPISRSMAEDAKNKFFLYLRELR